MKWKPNLEVLDNEFFSLRSNYQNYQRKMEELEKEQKEWKVRSNALRDHNDLENDHTRISKLVVLPKTENDKNIEKNHRYFVNSAFSANKKASLDSINNTSEMIRAESTPNPTPPTKRLLDLMNINDDIEVKKKVKRSLPPRQSSEKKSVSFSQKQMMGSL